MALTPEQIQELALAQCGTQLFGGPAPDAYTAKLMAALRAQLPLLYTLASGLSPVQALTVRYLRREILEALEGQLWPKKDGHLGPLLIQQSQLFEKVQRLKQQVQEEIVRVEARAAKSHRPAVGEILQAVPQPVFDPVVTVSTVNGVRVAAVDRRGQDYVTDPSDQGYGGHPLRRRGRYPPHR